MNANEINIKERINQRDGTLFILEYNNDGIPLCPHCGKPMVKVNDRWENAMCPCWWVGQDKGSYHAQVVIADTPQDEFAYRTRITEGAAKDRQDRQEKVDSARLRYAASDAQTKFSIVHDLRGLYGKRQKKLRNRVREVIARNGTFDEAMGA